MPSFENRTQINADGRRYFHLWLCAPAHVVSFEDAVAVGDKPDKEKTSSGPQAKIPKTPYQTFQGNSTNKAGQSSLINYPLKDKPRRKARRQIGTKNWQLSELVHLTAFLTSVDYRCLFSSK
jgi:hypothetical protein